MSTEPRNRPTRWIVLGAGAVGASIGALLHRAGIEVVLIARGEHGRTVRERGLHLRQPDRDERMLLPCVESASEIEFAPGDCVLWSTKLGDGEEALANLARYAGAETPIVCAVNGVAGEGMARAHFRDVVSMVVWLPATHLVPGEVLLYSEDVPGVLDVGPDSPTARSVAADLREAGFDSECRADIQAWKHAKWITNLGATAQALVTDHPMDVAALARAEGEAVLDAAGLDRIPTEDLLERCSSVRGAPIDGEDRAGGSTWQSHQRGKALETPFLESAIADLARKHGLEAPINEGLARAAATGRRLSAAEVSG